MRPFHVTRRPARAAGAALLAVGLLGGCSTSTLEIVDPDVLNVADYATAAGANPLRLGVIQDFQNVYSGNASLENVIVVSGNVSDEMYSTDTFDDRLFPNQRAMNENLPALDGFYRNMHRARSGASRAITVLRKVAPTPVQNIGELYAIRGYTENFFAELYCSGVPFSEDTDAGTEFGAPQTTSIRLPVPASTLQICKWSEFGWSDASTICATTICRVNRATPTTRGWAS